MSPRRYQDYATADDELYDLTKPKHRKTLASDGIANAFSSEETSQRVKRDTDAQGELGRPLGHVPYGYKRIYVDKELIAQYKHPEHTPVIVDVIEIVYRGESLMSIARRLNDAGIPSSRG